MTQNPEHFRAEDELEIAEQTDGSELPYGEVTQEDLATEELVYDGADLMSEDSDGGGYIRPDDQGIPETIEDRIWQEEEDPAVVSERDNPEIDEEAARLTEEVTRDVEEPTEREV